jgi:hypothetical protein
MALSQLQTDAYRAVLRAVAATQLDWVRKHLLGRAGCQGCATCAVQDVVGQPCHCCFARPLAWGCVLGGRSPFLWHKPVSVNLTPACPPQMAAHFLANYAGKASHA